MPRYRWPNAPPSRHAQNELSREANLSPKIEAHGAAQGHRYGAEMPSVLTLAIEALFRNGTGGHKQDIKRRMIDVRSSLDSVANESREHLNARNKTARSAEVANLAEQESRQVTPTERLKAMREYASAAGGLKAKGK